MPDLHNRLLGARNSHPQQYSLHVPTAKLRHQRHGSKRNGEGQLAGEKPGDANFTGRL